MHKEKWRSAAPVDGGAVRLELLGEFRLFVGEQDVSGTLGRSPKLKTILACLILNRERELSHDELIGDFYDDECGSDPMSALKMQIMRIRQALRPAFPDGVQPIISRRGTYRWNPQIPCAVDAEVFEALCRQAADSSMNTEERRDLYRKAMSFYNGDVALERDEMHWSGILWQRYRSCFINAAESYAELLLEQGDDALTEAVCMRGMTCDPVNESLCVCLIQALLRQQRYGEARNCYRGITASLQQDMGVEPSSRLKNLWTDISRGKMRRAADIDHVMDSLREVSGTRTAYFCSYEQFRSIYQLEARRAARTGAEMQVAMLSLGEELSTDAGMDAVQHTLMTNLRSSDVVARYSDSQFIIMLPNADMENSRKVMQRLIDACGRRYPGEPHGLSWQIRPLEVL